MIKDDRAGSDQLSERCHVTFDPASEPGSDAVMSALAEATGTSPDELEPIESVVDPIVFDALVRRRRRPVRVSFVCHEHHVTVDTGGDIWIRHSERAGRPEFECAFEADESPSHGVIRAIAAVKGVEPTGVAPLYDFIDPDALDAMVDGTTGAGASDVCVSFRVNGLAVEVSGDRHVTVRPLTAVA